MKRIYKKIEQDNGTITFYGANRWAELHFETKPPEDDQDYPEIEQYFFHYGRKYYLGEFMHVVGAGAPDYMKEFHGCANDSYFSGVVIKLD